MLRPLVHAEKGMKKLQAIEFTNRLYGSKGRTYQGLLHFFLPALFALLIAAIPVRADTLSIVALGDSLTAGYGLDSGESFPDQLQAALKADGIDAEIVNAGVSGDTASGGLTRVDWSVPDGTDGVILELGANDALRGVDPAETEAALSGILEKLKARNIPVLITGMRAPPNMGEDYAGRFDAIYPRLAEKFGAALYPFFLDGVAAIPELNLPDGIHPTKKGVAEIVTRMMPSVQTFIEVIR